MAYARGKNIRIKKRRTCCNMKNVVTYENVNQYFALKKGSFELRSPYM